MARQQKQVRRGSEYEHDALAIPHESGLDPVQWGRVNCLKFDNSYVSRYRNGDVPQYFYQHFLQRQQTWKTIDTQDCGLGVLDALILPIFGKRDVNAPPTNWFLFNDTESKLPMRLLRKLKDWALLFLLFGFLFLVVIYLEQGHEESRTGNAGVIDGDSLVLEGVEIRLRGIDAPEFNQRCDSDNAQWPCGRKAKAELAKLVRSKSVRCRMETLDQFDRWLATCFADGSDINQKMVAGGWAVSFGRYQVEEGAARNSKLGLWRGSFMRPQEWRREFGGDTVQGRGRHSENLIDTLSHWFDSIRSLISNSWNGMQDSIDP